MKVLALVFLTVISLNLHADRVDAEIFTAMDAVIENLPKEGRKAWPEYIISFGYPYRANAAYPVLAEIVSNNFEYVYANFSRIATNDLQRLIVLSSGWAYDENYYLVSYSKVLDLARTGWISKREFRWFEWAGMPSHRTSTILVRRYNEPSVREIIYRYQEFSGDTNRCERILSGRAKWDIVISDLMMQDPPLICKYCCFIAALITCLFLLFVIYRALNRRRFGSNCAGQGHVRKD